MRRRNHDRGFLGTAGLFINFIVELILIMTVLISIGIIVQSEVLISFGFIIAVILTLILNFIKIKPIIIYGTTIPIIIILVFFIPKILI
ncbi:MAG: hypothetical protein ACRC41_05315 [Sarcina sp.]